MDTSVFTAACNLVEPTVQNTQDCLKGSSRLELTRKRSLPDLRTPFLATCTKFKL